MKKTRWTMTEDGEVVLRPGTDQPQYHWREKWLGDWFVRVVAAASASPRNLDVVELPGEHYGAARAMTRAFAAHRVSINPRWDGSIA
jgi:hypothetical protein